MFTKFVHRMGGPPMPRLGGTGETPVLRLGGTGETPVLRFTGG
jgi:hypothetical protein